MGERDWLIDWLSDWLIEHKELAHVIMEDDKIFRWADKLETLESWWCSSSPKAMRLKTQEKPMFEFDGSKKLMSQVEGSQTGRIQKQNYLEE